MAGSDIELAGYRLPTKTRLAGRLNDPRWWINWKWRRYSSIPYCLAETGAQGWLEVPAPTRTRPLTGLLLNPRPAGTAARPPGLTTQAHTPPSPASAAVSTETIP